MGGKSSKPEPTHHTNDAHTDSSNKVMESSSGFHLFELHVPTLGLGFSTLLLLAVVILACYLLFKRQLRRRLGRAGATRSSLGRDEEVELGKRALMTPPPFLPLTPASFGSPATLPLGLPYPVLPPGSDLAACRPPVATRAASRFIEVVEEEPAERRPRPPPRPSGQAQHSTPCA